MWHIHLWQGAALKMRQFAKQCTIYEINSYNRKYAAEASAPRRFATIIVIVVAAAA